MKIDDTTPLIDTVTKDYPKYLHDVRERYQTYTIPANPNEAQLARLGYHVVRNTPKPYGEVVVETDPKLIDGTYYRQYQARKYTESELDYQLTNIQTKQAQRLKHQVTKYLEVGLPYRFQGKMYHIQMRPEDRINLLGLRMEANMRKEAGDDEWRSPFQFYENVAVMMDYNGIIDITTRALAEFTFVKTTQWQIADEIANAKHPTEVPVIPDNLSRILDKYR